MQEVSEKTHENTQSGGKFVDTLITQWVKRTGSNIALHQAEELQMNENSHAQEDKREVLHHERTIQILSGKLKQSRETVVSLSASLDTEIHNREEFQMKLTATWESIDTITEYFNYISEIFGSFQQHCANLSALYNDIIQKQQETIQKLQLSISKSKDLEQHIMQLENKSLFQEEKFQEAIGEQNKLQKQLENSTLQFENKLQLQENELTKAYTEEKLILTKEQQRLMLENENLQSRLQTVENEKYNKAKIAAQLETKVLLQEERLQEVLIEQNKLQKRLESTESEFCSQKNNLASTHAEEKKTLIEEQIRLSAECENLHLRLNTLEQDKKNTMEINAQKDILLSTLQNENLMYKDQIEAMKMSNNEAYNKSKELIEKQNMRETELCTKIQNLEAVLIVTKQRETTFINDINRIEKKLTNQMDYSKNLENKLSDTQRDLQLAQKQRAEMQNTLERTKANNEFNNMELQQQLKNLQKEKKEIIEQESTKTKNVEILYQNAQIKHAEEISALKNNYETHLLELKKTIGRLNETINNIREDNNTLNVSLMKMKTENNLNNYQSIMKQKNDFQEKLKETVETLQAKSINENPAKNQKQSNKKHRHEVHFDHNIVEIPKTGHNTVSTSMILSDDEVEELSLQSLYPVYSQQKESPKQQEAEVTSAGKKFFKSRPAQLRTYAKKRRNW